MYPILSFILFKSKECTSLISLSLQQIETEYLSCRKQTKNERDKYTVMGRLHQEKDEPTLTGSFMEWYRNNKLHRTRKDKDGKMLWAWCTADNFLFTWYRNGIRTMEVTCDLYFDEQQDKWIDNTTTTVYN